MLTLVSRAGRSAGERAREDDRRADAGGAGRAVRRGARAGAAPASRCGARAHVADLRGAGGAARAPAAHPAAAVVHPLALVAGSCRPQSAFRPPCSRSTGARSRSTRRRCTRSATGSTSPRSPASPSRTVRCGCSRSAGPRPPRASTPSSTQRGLADGVELELRGPSLTDEERAYRDGARASRSRPPVPRPRDRRRSTRAAGALVNNMRSGALDKVVFEAGCVVPAGARLESGLRMRSSPASSRRCGSRRTTRRRSPRASARWSTRGLKLARASGASCARASSATTRSSHWADARARGRAMTRSCTCRRSRASRARRRTCSRCSRCCATRGLGRAHARAARGRAGRARVRRGDARARACRPRRAGMRFDLDPTGAVRGLRGGAPTILHTHLVHADVLGLPAGALARVPVRVSTKHGFNEFRVEPRDRLRPTAPPARFAHRQIAISHGLARYLARDRGLRARTTSPSSTTGSSRGPSRRLPPAPTRLARGRAADPDQGLRPPAARVRSTRGPRCPS